MLNIAVNTYTEALHSEVSISLCVLAQLLRNLALSRAREMEKQKDSEKSER